MGAGLAGRADNGVDREGALLSRARVDPAVHVIKHRVVFAAVPLDRQCCLILWLFGCNCIVSQDVWAALVLGFARIPRPRGGCITMVPHRLGGSQVCEAVLFWWWWFFLSCMGFYSREVLDRKEFCLSRFFPFVLFFVG